jgi:hypothetical protein
MFTPLGSFADNVAPSSNLFGLSVFPEYYPKRAPCDAQRYDPVGDPPRPRALAPLAPCWMLSTGQGRPAVLVLALLGPCLTLSTAPA